MTIIIIIWVDARQGETALLGLARLGFASFSPATRQKQKQKDNKRKQQQQQPSTWS